MADAVREQLWRALVDSRASVEEIFAAWDVDGTNAINRTDFFHALLALGIGCSRSEANALFALLADSDSRVEYRKLQDVMHSKLAPESLMSLHKDSPPAFFDTFDQEVSGSMDYRQLRTHLRPGPCIGPGSRCGADRDGGGSRATVAGTGALPDFSTCQEDHATRGQATRPPSCVHASEASCLVKDSDQAGSPHRASHKLAIGGSQSARAVLVSTPDSQGPSHCHAAADALPQMTQSSARGGCGGSSIASPLVASANRERATCHRLTDRPSPLLRERLLNVVPRIGSKRLAEALDGYADADGCVDRNSFVKGILDLGRRPMSRSSALRGNCLTPFHPLGSDGRDLKIMARVMASLFEEIQPRPPGAACLAGDETLRVPIISIPARMRRVRMRADPITGEAMLPGLPPNRADLGAPSSTARQVVRASHCSLARARDTLLMAPIVHSGDSEPAKPLAPVASSVAVTQNSSSPRARRTRSRKALASPTRLLVDCRYTAVPVDTSALQAAKRAFSPGKKRVTVSRLASSDDEFKSVHELLDDSGTAPAVTSMELAHLEHEAWRARMRRSTAVTPPAQSLPTVPLRNDAQLQMMTSHLTMIPAARNGYRAKI